MVGSVADRGLLEMMGGENGEEAGAGGWFDWAFRGARLARFIFIFGLKTFGTLSFSGCFLCEIFG